VVHDGFAIRDLAKYVIASCEPGALHVRIARSDASIAGSVRYIVTPSQIVSDGCAGSCPAAASASGRSSVGMVSKSHVTYVDGDGTSSRSSTCLLWPCVAG
jgi:hypothetical protein